MRQVTTPLTANVELEKAFVTKSKGVMQVAGSFNGGLLSFYISLDNGVTKNEWLNKSGTHYQITKPDTVGFDLLFLDNNHTNAIIYVTLSGAINPNITIDAIDTRGGANDS